ncbi:MAG: peptidylprolyl isomerase [Bacteroidetes bacterium]|nr:peptidylprolyl isomerase [Bacteroidota bacterium]
MFKKFVIIINVVLLAFLSFNCGSTTPVLPASPLLIEIGAEQISLKNFNQQLEKNHGGADGVKKLSPAEKEKFLDLYLAFRLKVKEAYARNYDKNPEIISELNEYKKNLSVSYLLEKELITPAIQKYYSRQLEEIRASHILINIDPNDTLVGFKKALAISDSLKKKLATFEDLVIRNSQDPTALTNKGDIYFFTAGSLVPEFEEVAYNMNVNEVSNPVKTQFGYHIIKVTAKQKNRGKVQASHIMKRLLPEYTSEDSIKLKNELSALLDSIKTGKSFEELATKYSDDEYTKERGGNLGFFARRSIVPQFEEVAFNLKVGEVSGVVVSPYGYHIIKVTDEKPIPEFKATENEIRSTYQDMRYPIDLENLIKSLKVKTNFKINETTFSDFKKLVDSTKSISENNWDSSLVSIKNLILFTIGTEKISIELFVAIANSHPELRGLSLKESFTIQTMVDKITEKLLLEFEARNVEKKYSDFANLMKEYEEGVLLFKVEQDDVWDRLTINNDSLKTFWEERKHNYVWPDRVQFTEVFVSKDSVKKVIEQEMSSTKKVYNKKTKKDNVVPKQAMQFDTVVVKFNKRPATLSTFGKWELQPVSTTALTEKAWKLNEGVISEFFEIDGGFSKIRVDKKDAARIKTFEEAYSEISSMYQEYESNRLKNNLFESLKKKYNPKIVEETLRQVLR